MTLPPNTYFSPNVLLLLGQAKLALDEDRTNDAASLIELLMQAPVEVPPPDVPPASTTPIPRRMPEGWGNGRRFKIQKEAAASTWRITAPDDSVLASAVPFDHARFVADALNAAQRAQHLWIGDAVLERCLPQALQTVYTATPENKALLQQFARAIEAQTGSVCAVLIAWAREHISEGRAAELLGLDRLDLRAWTHNLLTQAIGIPDDPQAADTKRIAALTALAQHTEAHVASFVYESERANAPVPNDWEREILNAAIASLHADAEFWAKVDAWRALVPHPADPAEFAPRPRNLDGVDELITALMMGKEIWPCPTWGQDVAAVAFFLTGGGRTKRAARALTTEQVASLKAAADYIAPEAWNDEADKTAVQLSSEADPPSMAVSDAVRIANALRAIAKAGDDE